MPTTRLRPTGCFDDARFPPTPPGPDDRCTTIFHNPACSTSRDVLARLVDAGVEPVVVEYLKTPPSADRLRGLLDALGLAPRALLRTAEAPYAALGLADPALSDDALIAAMLAEPVLIQRPIVESARGTRLCRPAAVVDALLPALPDAGVRR